MKGNCGECDRRWCCDIDPDKCNEWPDPVPMTNADRIRDMSDEELAKMLWKTGRNYRVVCADPVVDFNEQYDDIFEWLQQPAKEDKHGTETD